MGIYNELDRMSNEELQEHYNEKGNNTMDRTYNGWTNYATWKIGLEWLNDYDHIHVLAERCETGDALHLSEELKEYVLSSWEELTTVENALFMDYAYSFLEDVNWYEIAEHYWNDNKNED